MRNPFRRRLRLLPQGHATQVTDLLTAEVAAGSLTGVFPSSIARLAVIVVTEDGRTRMLTSCPPGEITGLLARAAAITGDGPYATYEGGRP